MEHFLQQLAAIPEVAELIRRVDGGGCPAAVTGLQPVQRACVGAAVARASRRSAVFVCGDEREVRQLAGDLETLMGVRPVILLSREWQLRPGAVASREWERSRLAALYDMARGEAAVVVATADALMQRTLPPKLSEQPCCHVEDGRPGGFKGSRRELALCGLYPVRPGRGRGPVRPAGRHPGCVLSPDGSAGAV